MDRRDRAHNRIRMHFVRACGMRTLLRCAIALRGALAYKDALALRIVHRAVQLVQQPIEHGLRARPATAQGEGDMKSRIWARSGPKSYKVASHFVKHVYQQNMCL